MAIHEECGVFGVYSKKPTDVAKITYYGLYTALLEERLEATANRLK